MPQDLNSFLNEATAKLQSKSLWREFETYQECSSKYVDFCSNDYLGLAKASQPELLEFIVGQEDIYLGSTGSRLTTGTHEEHLELEEKIAKWKGTEAALFFGSGYLANLGALSSVLTPRDVVFNDAVNHSCIQDGIRLSGAKRVNFEHIDLEDLEHKLAKHRNDFAKAIIATDTIFSMDGDRADLVAISSLAKKYNCSVYVDEAHATGVFGSNGAGLVEELKEQNLLEANDIEIQMGTFSKALGLEGAYIAGSKVLIDYLKNTARTFMFSTAPSPLITRLISKNLDKLIEADNLRDSLKNKVTYFKEKLLTKVDKSRVINGDTPIFAILYDEVEAALKAAQKLRDRGFWLKAIRPPTVSSPRLRICLRADMQEEQLTKLIDALA